MHPHSHAMALCYYCGGCDCDCGGEGGGNCCCGDDDGGGGG